MAQGDSFAKFSFRMCHPRGNFRQFFAQTGDAHAAIRWQGAASGDASAHQPSGFVIRWCDCEWTFSPVFLEDLYRL